MNVKQLEIVTQIAKSGSLSRASMVLGLAQSIVSRQLSHLEQEWGERLFERTGRGMVLSDFGQLVFPQIEAFLHGAHQLEDAVKAASGVPTGSVKIGVVPSLADIVVPSVIADMKIAAPGIKLSFVEGLSVHLDDLLAAGRIDMAVVNRYGVVEPSSEDFLGEVTTYLVCSPKHKFAKRRSLAFEELDNLPLVIPSATSGLKKLLDQLGRTMGVRVNVHMEAESLSVMKRVATSGEAMTLLPYSAVIDEVKSGQLAVVKITEPEIPRKLMLASTQHHGMSRAARVVMSRIRYISPSFVQRACQCEGTSIDQPIEGTSA
ncbi:LysR family transcriptional regulator [Cupriavidus necator]|uniref:LysR family transcriptional regulator n=1 Tax=Cupriavidus necator TaxID=106590 RepID=UPI0039C121FA